MTKDARCNNPIIFESHRGVLREKHLGVKAYDELNSIDLGMLDMFPRFFAPNNDPNDDYTDEGEH